MPVFNSERFLRAAVDDLLAQSLPDFELLISDNDSTDGTWELCNQIAAEDPRVKLFRHERNVGPFENFASVLDRATSRYFCWAADDDWHHFRFLEALMQVLRAVPDAGLVFCWFSIFNHETGVKSPVITPAPSYTRLRSEALRSRFGNPVSNMLYGVMPTEIARRYFPRPYFDWGDAFMVAAISARHDVEVLPIELYGAGIKTALRKPTAADGVRISASTYRHKCIKLVFETLPLHQAVQLAALVWRESKRMDAEAAVAESQYRATLCASQSRSAQAAD
jgi:glycosyltransferase involved in cell wall biosynthesis